MNRSTTITVTRVLDAPKAEVWTELSRIERHVLWMHDAVELDFLSEQTQGVGTTFDCLTRVGPFKTTDRMEITEWEPPDVVGVRHVGLVTGEGRFRLETRDEDRTSITWSETLTFPWRLGGPIGSLGARPVLGWIWKRNLAALDELITAGRTPE